MLLPKSGRQTAGLGRCRTFVGVGRSWVSGGCRTESRVPKMSIRYWISDLRRRQLGRSSPYGNPFRPRAQRKEVPRKHTWRNRHLDGVVGAQAFRSGAGPRRGSRSSRGKQGRSRGNRHAVDAALLGVPESIMVWREGGEFVDYSFLERACRDLNLPR
jgi:hypothetical protein